MNTHDESLLPQPPAPAEILPSQETSAMVGEMLADVAASDTAAPIDEASAAVDEADACVQVAGEDGAVTAGVALLGESQQLHLPTMESQPLTAARDAAAFVAKIFEDVASADAPAAVVDVPMHDVATEPAADEVPQVTPEQALRQLEGRTVLVLGLGASGLAMARWCVRCGAARVVVADTRTAPPQLPMLQQALPQVDFVGGPFSATLVESVAPMAVYRSPGLSPDVVAPVVQAAAVRGVPVGGELTLFAAALQTLKTTQHYAPAVLAITGTNGKTTVTSLTGQLLEHAGLTVAVAGNIGPTLLDTLAEHLDAGTWPEAWVLELSSFQLDSVDSFEPTAAVVLNVTQDHLDWHGGMPAYSAAKARIFGRTGLMVLNRDDAGVMRMLPEPVKVKLQKPQLREHITFGADMPARPGDFGVEMVNGMAWLVRALEADETRKRSRSAEAVELHVQRLIPADALRIRGRHNAMNALAALALAMAAGASLAPMLFGLREYRGEPHRVEPVGIVNEIEYFDDSKGTNVGATVAALQGLGVDRRVVVILGGDGKGQDFSALAAPVARFARAVVLIGRDAPAIRAALADTSVALVDAQDMSQAVQLATQRAHAGDAVLMSPACASFDMFKDYAHRAQVFCDAVHALADAAGQSLEGGL